MVINKVKIIYLSTEECMNIYLTEKQMSYFGVNDTNSIVVKFASIEFNLKVSKLVQVTQDKNKLYLSKDLKEKLYIPNGTVLQIKNLSSNGLELGPLIGVFIDNGGYDNLSFGKSSADYKLFSMTSEKVYGMCCFFSIDNVNFDKGTIKGTIRKNQDWICITLPIPKVIYDQNHKLDSRANSIELRNRLGNEYIVLNSMAKLSKWETIITLNKNLSLINHIPKTTIYESIESLKSSLDTCSRFYLKPNSLSKGKGVFCITKKSPEEFIVEYRTKEQNHIVKLKTLEDLNSLLSKYKEIGQGYIIQEEIKKASYKDNPFDIRLLYQKDYTGTWLPSGIVVRLGPYGSIITSPRSGGSVVDFPTVLKEVFQEDLSDKNGLYENMLELGKEICISIESEFGNCVELGLDIAIDVHKKIWIIEVNGKPLKVSLKRLRNSKLVSDFTRHPIEYAVHMSGFKSLDTDKDKL